MTIHLYLKADGVRGQRSAYNEYGGASGRGWDSQSEIPQPPKTGVTQGFYGNETERRIEVFFKEP